MEPDTQSHGTHSIPAASLPPFSRHQYGRLASCIASQERRLCSQGYLRRVREGVTYPNAAPRPSIHAHGVPLYVLGQGAAFYVGRHDDGTHRATLLADGRVLTLAEDEFMPVPVRPPQRGGDVIVFAHSDPSLNGMIGLVVSVDPQGNALVISRDNHLLTLPMSCLGSLPQVPLPQLHGYSETPQLEDDGHYIEEPVGAEEEEEESSHASEMEEEAEEEGREEAEEEEQEEAEERFSASRKRRKLE